MLDCRENIDIDLKKIKLIIWDLDDTFWKGTLSEGDVEFCETNVNLIKLATDRGIINSICSKNEIEDCKTILEKNGLWEYFVFPSINWEAKGSRIKNQILDMALRAENVLFLDDNSHNLEEVKFANPGIMTALPDVTEYIFNNISTVGKDDAKHSRLKQYKVMEEKHKAKSMAADNHDFLLSCGIVVEVTKDCLPEKTRIAEMIQRTNQLNYTKKRIDETKVEEILKDTHFECGYITVKDNFGEYGISGFYALKDGVLEHFLFSCRVLGMGVEQYIYSQLGFPTLETEGSVAVSLNTSECPDWINVSKNSKEQKNNLDIGTGGKILVKGPCDMLSVFSYIKDSDKVDTEFTFISKETGVSIESYNHTEHIVNSFTLNDESKKRIIDEVAFSDKRLYQTDMFDLKYDIVFLSLLLDASLGMYKRKETGETLCFGHCGDDFTDKKNHDGIISGEIYNSNCKFTKEQLIDFSEKYEFCGRVTPNHVIENLKKILSVLPQKTKLVLISGSEIKYENEKDKGMKDVYLYYKELNSALLSLKNDYKNVDVITFTKYTTSQECYYNSSNHFTKKVYFELANDMVDVINKTLDAEIGKPSKLKLFAEQKLRTLTSKFLPKKLILKMYYLFKVKKK